MINFYLKDKNKPQTAVIAQVYLHGKRYRIATGVSVQSEHWQAGKQRLKVRATYPDAEHINLKLNELEQIIKSNALMFKLSNQEPTTDQLLTPKKDTPALISYGRDFVDHCGLSAETKRKYTTALNKLTEYQADSGHTIHFNDIDIAFFRSFKKWFYSLINPLNEKPYSKNYFGSVVKIIKSLVRRAAEDGLTTTTGITHSQFTTDNELTSSIYLSIDELTAIHRLEFTRATIEPFFEGIRESDLKRKIASYNTVRARFLLGAFTGLRVSDFLKLPMSAISDKYVTHRTKKTGQDVVIPIHPILAEVVASGHLVKKVSEQKLNVHIKEICRIAGITQPVTTYRSHAGSTMAQITQKCNLVATHTARRSFATNAYLAGIPAIGIMKITGHRTESSFLRYIWITQAENAEVLLNHSFFRGESGGGLVAT